MIESHIYQDIDDIQGFLIVGGGVIGMMIAMQLADAGHFVAIVECGQCGREASWVEGRHRCAALSVALFKAGLGAFELGGWELEGLSYGAGDD
ncbi:FAD-dependent oxidoreductase [Chromohalobacter japonicus]|uniref:FAD-dependent oxidoreductase n=1 Tax=Chromohalobacter japonicus TaxID=223900 RepID=UPI003F919742